MSLKVDSEIKIDSEPYVAVWDDRLFVGTEDGSITSFDENLVQIASWPAHAAQPFALTSGDGKIYSSSNDGGIRVWTREGQKLAEIPTTGADIGTLKFYNKELYAGDEDGKVFIFDNNIEKTRYNVLEEVKDLAFSAPFLFTVRDLDVTVTEIRPDESKTRSTTRHTMEGRAPLRLAGRRLLVTARGGNNLRLHDASVDSNFKQLHEVKVSDMILTSLAVSGDYAWTAGWDGCLRRWKITEDQLEPAGEVNLGACINAIANSYNNMYALIAGGKIVRVKTL